MSSDDNFDVAGVVFDELCVSDVFVVELNSAELLERDVSKVSIRGSSSEP